MNNKSIGKIDELYESVKSYKSTDDFTQLLETVKRFREIAPFNAMLIHMQKPGSQFVATASDWYYRFGRFPKQGARPLIILIPFGPVQFVYEYGDTYGDTPLPESVINPFRVEGKITESDLNYLIDNLVKEGILYSEEDYGTSSGGALHFHSDPIFLKYRTERNEYVIESHYTIVINRNTDIATKYATILHELGHYFCGHIYLWDKVKYINQRNLPLNSKEFEAETVSWLICERNSIHNPSAPYLSGYLTNHDEIPNVSIDQILKAVNSIEAILKGKNSVRKELVSDKHSLQAYDQLTLF